MNKQFNLYLFQLIAAGLIASCASAAPAQVYINEIYFNPPNPPLGEDSTREFVELRGQPNISLANHYLIFVDTPIAGQFPGSQGSAGVIEQIFDLNTRLLGTNGFLTLRQKNSGYTVAPNTTDLKNGLPTTICTTSSPCGPGFGSGTTGANIKSSIGASDRNSADGVSNGEIESGFTALLIHTDGSASSAPSLGTDLDVGNNGLDPFTGTRSSWTIVDAIGISEPDAGTGSGGAYNSYYYAKINYGTEAVDLNPNSPTFFDPHDPLAPHMASDATYVSLGTGFEAEYAGRWGNSTGQSDADWNIVDTTDNVGSGYQSTGTDPSQQPSQPNAWGFRVSTTGTHPADDGDTTPPNSPNPPPPPASTKGVPYGTIITNTLGAPNFLLGDYDKGGVVNAADYVVWRKTVGQTGTDTFQHPADGDHNYVVGQSDYAVWRAHFGEPSPQGSSGAGSSLGATSSMIPEPAGWCLAVLAPLIVTQLRKRPVR